MWDLRIEVLGVRFSRWLGLELRPWDLGIQGLGFLDFHIAISFPSGNRT